MGTFPARLFTEATHRIEGDLTMANVEDLLRSALTDLHAGEKDTWTWVRDFTDTWVAYELEGPDGCDTWKVGYSIDEATNVVTFDGEPEKVILKTSYEEVKTESTDAVVGTVLEAVAPAADGGRVFRVRIISTGTSRNGVEYSEAVLRAAAPMYEGAKSFDHHRTMEELRTSTTAGLVGHFRNVEAHAEGIDADLHLVPSATQTAELLDATLDAQQQGLPPVVGISHHVAMSTDGARPVERATAIRAVLSADVVADPSAGGMGLLKVAGGLDPTIFIPNPAQEATTMKTLKELLDALRAASADDRAKLLEEHGSILTDSGFRADDVPTLLGETPATDPAKTDPEPKADPTPEPKADELVDAGAGIKTEAFSPDTYFGRAIVREAAVDLAGGDAKRQEAWEQRILAGLPKTFTEAQVRDRVAVIKESMDAIAKDGLVPKAPALGGGEDDLDKKRRRLEASFKGLWQEGYTRISEAFCDITGEPYQALTDAFVQRIMRESWAGPVPGGKNLYAEALTSTSWGEILADVMHKSMVAAYQGAATKQDWKKVVRVSPLSDFRTYYKVRMGGYGLLPNVLEGQPYQPLTSPTDEQASLAAVKKGGTESYTFEMAKNDDLSKLTAIPQLLADAANLTLYYEVFGPATGDATGYFTANPTLYDSVALFHSTHANTASGTTLGNAGLNTLRQKMRDQAAYGISTNILGLTPKFLLVPNELEDAANQLCTSDRAVPSSTGASDQPNLHKGLEPIVVDTWTDANDYFVAADPASCPGIEIGFMDGKVDPELFLNDDPRQGAVFSSDEITYKIRHIWGSTVVDYRGLQRMTN